MKQAFPSKSLLADYEALGLDNRQAHLLYFAGILPDDYRALKQAPVVAGETIVPRAKEETCLKCKKKCKPYIRITADGNTAHVCEPCMIAEREAMLTDPQHPAWKYYDVVAKAAGIKPND